MIRRTRYFFFAIPIFVFVFDLGFFAASLLPQSQVLPDKQVDLIAVPTGGQRRLRDGIALLAQERGKWLFVSGVEPGIALESLLRANRVENVSEDLQKRILLGYESTSTHENALEIREALERVEGHSLILVTSSYHLNRARKLLEREFERIPKMNVEIYSAVTESPNFPRRSWWLSPRSWTILLWEYLKSLPLRLGFE